MARPALRPWSSGERVAPGPDYEYKGEQLDSEEARGFLVEPDHMDFTEWATSCCQVHAYGAAGSPFSGWSPGRSATVEVVFSNGTSERYWYKLFDEGMYDIVEHPDRWLALPLAEDWKRVWGNSLHFIFRWELHGQVANAFL